MAQKVVGKGFTLHLSASLRAGSRALEELCSQGHVSTTQWFNLVAEGIVDESPYTSVTRRLHFTLEGGQRVEVKVMAWQEGNHRETEDIAEKRHWAPIHVYVEKGEKMRAFENHVDLKGYPWSRQPDCDKPLPDASWRAPRVEEVAAYATAVASRDKESLLKVYQADLINWDALIDGLDIHQHAWVRNVLRGDAA